MANIPTYKYLDETGLGTLLDVLRLALDEGWVSKDTYDELVERVEATETWIEAFDIDSQISNSTVAEFTGTVKVPTVANETDDTKAASTAFVHSVVNAAISKISGIDFEGPFDNYDALVADGSKKKGVIYLVKKTDASAKDSYDEYYWSKKDDEDVGHYEYFGSTAIDLTDYLKKEDIGSISDADIKSTFDNHFKKVVSNS